MDEFGAKLRKLRERITCEVWESLEKTAQINSKSESHWIEKIFFGSRRANEPDIKAGKATKYTENVSRDPVT